MMNTIYKFLCWFRAVVMGNPLYICRLYLLEMKGYQLRLERNFSELDLAFRSLQSAHERKPNRKLALVLVRVEDALKHINTHSRVIRSDISAVEEAIALFEAVTEACNNLNCDAASQEIDRYYLAKLGQYVGNRTRQ